MVKLPSHYNPINQSARSTRNEQPIRIIINTKIHVTPTFIFSGYLIKSFIITHNDCIAEDVCFIISLKSSLSAILSTDLFIELFND